MKITGKIESATLDRKTRHPVISIHLDGDSAELDDLMSCEKLNIEIKPYRQKRSLNANAYAWVLIDKLAEKLNIPREEVYRHAVTQIGGVSEIVSVKKRAVGTLTKVWKSRGLGWQVETIESNGDDVYCILYYGSSEYDSSQMKRLTDQLVTECKLQGIDTMSAEERSRLLDSWK